MQNPFTSPTFTKMSTSHTQNAITLKGSEIVFAKIKKKLESCFTESFKISPCLLFIESSLAQLTCTKEIRIKDKIRILSKTTDHWNISTLQ